ncbi:Na+-transporting NADH:ubiquinone oxidoreductase subunit B [Polaribacter sp. Hel1_33_78]|jgi:Na+-transporting NADH:ubiquinone oxidoreductase subunit B|uniref:NADH:ubiquinone reductase (Na(+)-transporting) subunit B n=2 Tax=Polaribacter TaxID=52959 RepID=UPI00052BB075|nr:MULTISPECIES: NADH:ubiquinone reductase (Na(+)-transporting) subunit B [unclassified Polaribacter]KGL59544.1 Na(+)-translocating NADH-quinone reductase subunit B [Polaribacter sp. Hel1_33_49]MBT3740822.1 NADH:ubiquinone reductase (Na(+)-transporting) subunit B [Polaribacter sp.]PKV64038.1 Na+-transporting NADH:ubiquinone oxidoreductase subunit B [Polaribacter sp. Hel1_33_96]SDU20993.1 Na+-transporting NADH:ubiquinone oxidoreductase subunit B [Polaribacter sp. Hel1_33_78]
MSLKQNLHILKEKYKGTKMAPAFNAIHTFLYLPNEVTHGGTHIKAADDLKRTMNIVIMALVPCLLFGMFNAGYQHYAAIDGSLRTNVLANFFTFDNFWIGIIKVLPLVIVSYGVGLLVEFIFAVIKGHEVEEGYLVTGMLVPLIVPIDTPLWMLSVAVVFGVVIGKEVFGGTGMNILNPALTIRAFLFFAYPTWMSGDKVWVYDAVNRTGTADAISGETILGSYAQNQEVIYSNWDKFAGFIPGSIGETSTLLILLGAAILVFTKIGSWRIILSTFIGAAVMGMIFNQIVAADIITESSKFYGLMNTVWYEHLMIGGLAFGAVFMATDPVTGSQTNKGKWMYGFLIGFISIMIRVFNPAYPEGVFLAILLMNVFAPTIDHYVVQGNVKKRLKRTKVKTA